MQMKSQFWKEFGCVLTQSTSECSSRLSRLSHLCPSHSCDWITQDVFVIQGSSSAGIRFGLWAKKKVGHAFSPHNSKRPQCVMSAMRVNPPHPQAWRCHATVSQLTARLATVGASCQHSSEHLVKVLLRTQKVTEK